MKTVLSSVSLHTPQWLFGTGTCQAKTVLSGCSCFFLLQNLVQTKILGAGCPALYTRTRGAGLVKDVANDPPQASETFLYSSALRGPGKAF